MKLIERYRVQGATSSVDIISNTGGDTVTFQPGEFVAWLIKVPDKKSDTVPPAVKLILPYEPTIIGPLTIRAEAKDNKKIKQVEFFVNAKSIGVDTTAPYSIIWDGKTALKDEWLGLKAVATDTAGNQSEARAMIKVTDPAK
jgi:chitinase